MEAAELVLVVSVFLYVTDGTATLESGGYRQRNTGILAAPPVKAITREGCWVENEPKYS